VVTTGRESTWSSFAWTMAKPHTCAMSLVGVLRELKFPKNLDKVCRARQLANVA